MTLLESRMRPFCILDKTTAPDGMGGTTVIYRDGAPFEAATTMLQSQELEVAYQSGQKRIYAIFFKPTVGLEHNMRVKRVENGRVYRITATPEPCQTAPFSALQLLRTTMEEVDA